MRPIPDLDHRGLLPPGRYHVTLDDARDAFCHGLHRQRLWDGFLDFLRFLHDQKPDLNYPLALGGGFVTDKQEPADIDCAILLQDDVPPAVGWGMLMWRKANKGFVRTAFGVDFNVSLPAVNDFQDFFGYVGEKEAEAKKLKVKDWRGILVIEQW